MKTILLSLSILIFNMHLSQAQTKKIALRSHSGANSSFTIYVPDEFGLGPTDYYYPKSSKKKKCPLNIKPIESNQIQVKDSMDSIQLCVPLPPSKSKHKSTAPKSKPRGKKKKAKKIVKKKATSIATEIEPQQITTQNNANEVQSAGFAPPESSESLLVLLLSIPALLFFIITNNTPLISQRSND